MKHVTKDPRPRLVIACLLVLALAVGGMAYAKPKKKVPRNSVGTAQLKNDAVTAAKVAVGAIGTSEIADGAIGAPDLALGAVGAPQIANGGVGAPEIANGGVGSPQIADGSVGSADLAPGVVPSRQTFVNAPAGAVAIGTTATEVGELTALPDGNYEIQAKLWLDTPSTDPVVTCELVSGATTLDTVQADASVSEQAPVFLLAASELTADVELECTGTVAGSSATNVKLVASQVGSITVQP
jgi:hypothetical protein